MTDEDATPFSITAEHLERQLAFSVETFGPNWSVAATLDHPTKEIEEVRAEPDDIYEWVDMLILTFGGALRRGFPPQALLDALLEKQTINENRTWPDWRTAEPDKAIFHKKDPDETPAEATAEEKIEQGIQAVRNKVQADLDSIARTEKTVRAIMVTQHAITEMELVKEIVAKENVTEYLACYAISNLLSRGELHRDHITSPITLLAPRVEDTLRNLVPQDGEIIVTELIKEATKRHPDARVRTAYWDLVIKGELIPNSSGFIRRPL